MRHLRLILVLLLVGGTTVLWLRRASDEDDIRAQLTRLAAALHTGDAPSNPVFRLPRLRNEFEAVLDDGFHANIPELPQNLPRDRKGLADIAAQVTGSRPNLDVSFSELEIKIDDAKTTAQVAATAKVTSGGENPQRAVRPANFLFYKRSGTWKITSVTVWPEKPTE